MTPTPTNLLRRLEPAVRPAAATAALRLASSASSTAADVIDFESLVDRARRGALGSDGPVQLPNGTVVDDDDMLLLARIADQAQAAGSRRALIFMNNRALILDVAARRVDEEVRADDVPGRLVAGIDAAVIAPPTDPAKSAGPAPAPDPKWFLRLDGGAWSASLRDFVDRRATEKPDAPSRPDRAQSAQPKARPSAGRVPSKRI